LLLISRQRGNLRRVAFYFFSVGIGDLTDRQHVYDFELYIAILNYLPLIIFNDYR